MNEKMWRITGLLMFVLGLAGLASASVANHLEAADQELQRSLAGAPKDSIIEFKDTGTLVSVMAASEAQVGYRWHTKTDEPTQQNVEFVDCLAHKVKRVVTPQEPEWPVLRQKFLRR